MGEELGATAKQHRRIFFVSNTIVELLANPIGDAGCEIRVGSKSIANSALDLLQ